jgi:hypothetical protein
MLQAHMEWTRSAMANYSLGLAVPAHAAAWSRAELLPNGFVHRDSLKFAITSESRSRCAVPFTGTNFYVP